MDICDDEKQKILNEVTRCVQTIFARSTNAEATIPISIDSQLIISIDNVLQYGLLNCKQGYWSLVRSCSHIHTLQTVEQWIGTQAPFKLKGQAWLLATLVEGSLQSYLQCVIADRQTIKRVYAPHAIMQDAACVSQFCSLLRGLETIPFEIPGSFEARDDIQTSQKTKDVCGYDKSALTLPFDGPLTASGPTTAIITSSMTSSLASPEDSGFTQLDSETDTASYSEIILEGDCSNVKEEGAILRTDHSSYASVPLHEQMENMTASDIVNGNTSSFEEQRRGNDDEIVYLRPKKSKGKAISSKQQKRVSFHDCLPKSDEEENSAVENFPTKSINTAHSSKRSRTILDSFKISPPNLSFAIDGMPSLAHRLDTVEIGKDTSVLCKNDLAENLSDENTSLFSRVPDSRQSCQHMKKTQHYSIVKAMKTMLSFTVSPEHICKVSEERGIPEGQEDPPQKYHQHIDSAKLLNEFSIDACDTMLDRRPPSPILSCSSLKPQCSSPHRTPNTTTNSTSSGIASSSSVLNQKPSKACLVKRFLRSVTEKKLSNHRLATALVSAEIRVANPKKIRLYIPGAKPVDLLSQELLLELEQEILEASSIPINKHAPSQRSNNLDPSKFVHLLNSKTEIIYKIVRIQSSSFNSHGMRALLYAVVTDHTLYVCHKKLKKETSLQLSHISLALVSPSSQWILFRCLDGSSLLLVSGETDGAATLISSIEYMLRKRGQKASTLPSVYQMSLEDISLKSPWISILQGERVYHFSIVHATEDSVIRPCTPLGLLKKAHFMYRISSSCEAGAWEPGFFVLKSGVLYVFSDEGTATPPHMLNLKGVSVSLTLDAPRPHTIEVGSLQLAAPDNNVASDWLRALQMCSAGVYDIDTGESNLNFVSGSLLLTGSRVILVPYLGAETEVQSKSPHPLLVAYLSDVSSLSVGDGVCWCVLELSCREVQQSGGDYIVFFNTVCNTLSFLETMWELSPSLKKVTNVLAENEPLRHHCEKLSSFLP